jgi:hypothetical protein
MGPIIAAKIMSRVRGLDFFPYPNKYLKIGSKSKGEM